jgi:hypothetical protein
VLFFCKVKVKVKVSFVIRMYERYHDARASATVNTTLAPPFRAGSAGLPRGHHRGPQPTRSIIPGIWARVATVALAPLPQTIYHLHHAQRRFFVVCAADDDPPAPTPAPHRAARVASGEDGNGSAVAHTGACSSHISHTGIDGSAMGAHMNCAHINKEGNTFTWHVYVCILRGAG